MGDELASRAGIWSIRRFDTIDSTNRWLLDEARAGAAEGLVAVADEQTSGRGRRGREWIAPPGSSLLVSVLLRPPLDASRVHLVTAAAALALADAVEAVSGVRPDLKWPNDLVVAERKLAGILTEVEVDENGAVRAVVVGAGCNVQWDTFPPELSDLATACNVEAGGPVDRTAILDEYLAQLLKRIAGLREVAADYGRRVCTLGRRVRVTLPDREVVGAAIGLDDLGRLVVRTDDGETVTVTVGDVEHLRNAT
jgi:BirA family biotin operon repressor/biotin-[acetyl-CoA-carboxylase] ligase